eukprot:tig00020556_g10985.t1
MSPDAAPAIQRSINDRRAYRHVLLPNNLQALVISDPETDKAAASLDVHVGHHSDPPELPGLAHFLEHLLFLGTAKYPDEGSYKAFLSMHGGSSNAFTSAEHTCYYFSVTHAQLEGALDRFAQFFVAPLMTESATERELKAVDSEHKKNLQSDTWRLMQLLKDAANPEHPFHKFGTGSLETLLETPRSKGLDVRAALLAFHDQYYSANIMRLAVLGREPLDVLEAWVREKFEPVRDRAIPVPTFKGVPPFGPEQLRETVQVVPVKQLRSVGLLFPIPGQTRNYRSKPTRYISHLIGHEGPGSLLSLFKGKGWADALEAGEYSSGSEDFSMFSITVVLTEAGEDHVEEAIEAVFSYIELLRRAGPQRWVFDEIREIAEMQFRFKDKEEPSGFVSWVAGRMHEYPLEHLLSGAHLFFDFVPELIEETLALLTPDNLRVNVISKKFEGKTGRTERWYGTPHNRSALAEGVLARWRAPPPNDALHLPPPNPFIPTDFTLLHPPSPAPAAPAPSPPSSSSSLSSPADPARAHPRAIRETGLARVWYKPDTRFSVPKAHLYCDFVSPVAYYSPVHVVYTRLFTKLVEDALNEYTYFAEVAGLHYTLYNIALGFRLVVRGYSHKLALLVKRIVERLASYTVDPERFALVKDQLRREYRNFFLDQPHQHAVYTTNVLLENARWHMNDYVAVLDETTPEGLQAHKAALVRQLFLECLINGNLSEPEALALVEEVEGALKCSALLPSQMPDQRIVRLCDGTDAVYEEANPNESDSNSAIEAYFQLGLESTREDVLLDLLAQVMSKPAFHQLRTNEQLGYIVFSGVRRDYGVQGLRVIIQSASSGPRFLDERIDAFIASFEKTLAGMSADEFGVYVKSVIANKLEKDKNLAQESMRWWSEIAGRTYEFDRVEREVAELRKVTQEQLLAFYRRLVAIDSPHRRKLSVRVGSRAHSEIEATAGAMAEAEEKLRRQLLDDEAEAAAKVADAARRRAERRVEVIKDIYLFRRSMPLYPHSNKETRQAHAERMERVSGES